MFLGMDFYGENIVYNTEIALSKIYDIRLKDSIVDEVSINEKILDYTNSNKEEWGFDTILLAPFTNSLEAGNFDNKGVPIEYVRFKKRRKDTLEWQVVADIQFDKLEQLYKVIDRLVQATEEYEYAVVPVTSNVEGKESIAEIHCDFEGVWLVDKNLGIQFAYDLNYGSIDSVGNTAIFEPLQSKYPYVHTGILDYNKGNISSTVISSDAITGEVEQQLNIRRERLLRENILNFLKNKQPKILKDGNGRYYMVMVLNPKEKPFNNMYGAISNVSFDWVEIGDVFNNEDLENANLI